ncbi:MAG: OadG family transporter subunit [Bacteroides sp.]
MKKTMLFATLTLVLALFTSCGEKRGNSKLLLNEVLVCNESNYQDDYGQHSAWVEIFNKSYTSADLAGWYLKHSCGTQADTVSYFIPKGDVLTLVKPRQHALFWADGHPNKGTFHTSFTLDPTQDNWIGLYDGGGHLVDQVTVRAGQLATDQSYARINDAADEWEVKGASADKYVTPSTNNQTLDSNYKREKFRVQDSTGIGMAITAMSVVFSGLLILFVSFMLAGRLALSMHHRHKNKQQAAQVARKAAAAAASAKQEAAPTGGKAPEGEVYAAIAMALYELQANVHDVESNVLTIKRTAPSAWSNKANTLRQMPEKK